jgi:hypothetical protein
MIRVIPENRAWTPELADVRAQQDKGRVKMAKLQAGVVFKLKVALAGLAVVAVVGELMLFRMGQLYSV